ncbi:response regulator transcription factor [Neobacillus sp. OS1-32]|uniref:response regulator transcription factor n=1 Tax=Neobacillus sp. OS1-32 TaxID=3070682 RepID=UPI0027E09C35|nr:response regulator transcription factor [Neobacillus sp. OS1-32]WML28660.1 response regulator transcription factor [Neobacillus sp. OS1-32]
MIKILVVDDEFEMRQLLRLYLQQEGFVVEEAENGKEAYEKIVKHEYQLMILDIMMPLLDGWQTLEQIRKVSDLPVMMLTAKGTVKDKVAGLSKGADDYLVKPFDAEELIARVHALLRRTHLSAEKEHLLKYKGIIVDLNARDVIFHDKKISLTQTEFDLLRILLEHRGIVLSREQLVELVWGIEFTGEDRTVDSHIKNLRDKLKAAGVNEQPIKTVWGIGYKVE